jgi:hypothetical protein
MGEPGGANEMLPRRRTQVNMSEPRRTSCMGQAKVANYEPADGMQRRVMDAGCSARLVKAEAMCADGQERGVNARHAAEKDGQKPPWVIARSGCCGGRVRDRVYLGRNKSCWLGVR